MYLLGLLVLSLNEIQVTLSFSSKSFLSIITSNDILNVICILLIISQFIVLVEYIRKAIIQEKQKNKENNQKENKQNNKLKKKNKEELLFALFDTDFFIENRDGGIKKLLYKTDKNTKK